MTYQLIQPFEITKNSRGSQKLQAVKKRETRQIRKGRLPRISRLMALALRFDRLTRQKKFRSYAEIARHGQVSRARLTQILNLTLLAPCIVEELLHLPRIYKGRDPITERDIRPIAYELQWHKQIDRWQKLKQSKSQ